MEEEHAVRPQTRRAPGAPPPAAGRLPPATTGRHGAPEPPITRKPPTPASWKHQKPESHTPWFVPRALAPCRFGREYGSLDGVCAPLHWKAAAGADCLQVGGQGLYGSGRFVQQGGPMQGGSMQGGPMQQAPMQQAPMQVQEYLAHMTPPSRRTLQ